MYSVKVTHNGEVRRLQVRLDGIASTPYDQLIQTVRNIFPDLQSNRSFCLTWQDDEGDTVTVSSELELAEAIRVMSEMYGGNSLRFTVKKFEGPTAAAANSTQIPSPFVAGGDRIAAAMKREAEDAVHYGVQCDECGMSPIVGVRYKCTVRHNYDLCSTCFEKKTQPYQCIKIETPLDRKGCKRLDKGCRKWGQRLADPAAPHPPHGPHGPPPHPHHFMHGRHPHGGRGGRGMFHWFGGAAGHPEGIPYESCEDYYGPFTGEQEGCEEGAEGANANEDKKGCVPPPPHRRGGPHGPHHPVPPHCGIFGGRGPFGGRGGPHPHPHHPPRGPWGGRGFFGFGGPLVVEADLYVDGENEKKDNGTSATATTATPTAEKEGTAANVIHYGVTCDRCGASPIKGYRYKCTVRNDFDVCAACYESELQPYPMLKIATPGGEGTVITPGAPIVRDLNDEDAGLQAAISESMAKVSLGNSKLTATSATEDEVDDVYTEDHSFTFVDTPTPTAAPVAVAAVVPSPEEQARQAAEAKQKAEEEALAQLWARELGVLSDMGFTDASVLIPLLQQHIVTPASQASANDGAQAAKAVEGMQTVVATLLLGQSGIRR